MKLLLAFLVALFVGLVFIFWGIHQQTLEEPKEYSQEFKRTVPDQNLFESNWNYSVKEIFDLKYKYYKDELKSLKGIQINILVLIVISLLIIIFKTKTITIPLISVPIPDGIIYLIIFFGGIYMWVNFGLTLNNVIDTRLSLHHLLEILQRDDSGHLVSYGHSLEHVLSDSNFIDNFCIHYFDIFSRNGFSNSNEGIFVAILTYFGLYVIYAYILGLFVSTLIVSTIEYIKQKNINKSVSRLMLFVMFIMLIASSYGFGFKMPFAFIWVGAIWMWAAIGIGTWKWKWNKIVDTRIKNKTTVNAG